MSKKSRKRNKPYRGADAASQQPVVHRYKAVERSKFGEWWFDNKRKVKVFGIGGGAALLVAYLLFELFRLIF